MSIGFNNLFWYNIYVSKVLMAKSRTYVIYSRIGNNVTVKKVLCNKDMQCSDLTWFDTTDTEEYRPWQLS